MNNSQDNIQIEINPQFEERIMAIINPYYGKSIDELKKLLNIKMANKESYGPELADKLFSINNITHEELLKSNTRVCTIIIDRNVKRVFTRIFQTITTAFTSLPPFDFKEISKERSWEDSQLRNELKQTRFLLMVFDNTQMYSLIGSQFWSMPETDVENVRPLWEKTVSIINDGCKGLNYKPQGGMVFCSLVEYEYNPVCYIRNHSIYYKIENLGILPNGRQFPKQNFNIKSEYIAKQLNPKFYEYSYSH